MTSVPARENLVATATLDAALHVHRRLGPGLFEAVYEEILAYELRRRGLRVAQQVPMGVHYDGLRFDLGYKADLVVDKCVIVELKSVERASPVHAKQVLTYLRLSGLRLGLLINFGMPLLRDGFERIANGMPNQPPVRGCRRPHHDATDGGEHS